MPTYDPLSDQEIDLLNQIATQPLDISVGEQVARGINKNLNYLQKLGYLSAEHTHVARDSADNRWTFTRTEKPLP